MQKGLYVVIAFMNSRHVIHNTHFLLLKNNHGPYILKWAFFFSPTFNALFKFPLGVPKKYTVLYRCCSSLKLYL